MLIDIHHVATVVVFIFIKGHEKSKHYHGVIHPKFLDVAKGPWPRRAPYVFVLSYYERINKAQYAAIKHCLAAEDNPLLIRIEFKNHVAAAREYMNRQKALEEAAPGGGDSSVTAEQKTGEGGLINYAKTLLPGAEKEQEKGKEKEKESETAQAKPKVSLCLPIDD